MSSVVDIKVLDTFEITGRGTAYCTVEPDPIFQRNDRVRLPDGTVHSIRGIERHCITPAPGRNIALLLERCIDWEALVAEVDGVQATQDFGPHYLVVDAVWPEDGEADWSIEHTSSCNLRTEEITGAYEGAIRYYREESDCPYSFEVDNCGTDAFDKEPHELQPGHYPIAWWHRTYNHWECGPEYDSGIAVGEKQPRSTTAVVEAA